jgi:predicted nucleic acid-binding protein
MKDRIFLDANILVYANDRTQKEKQEKAKRIIADGILSENSVISAQVISEFFVTITRKIQVPLSQIEARNQILLLKNLEILEVDFSLILNAMEIINEFKFSYWDSLIISAALKSKCTILYSEDLNHGQTIRSVIIQNPFIYKS